MPHPILNKALVLQKDEERIKDVNEERIEEGEEEPKDGDFEGVRGEGLWLPRKISSSPKAISGVGRKRLKD